MLQFVQTETFFSLGFDIVFTVLPLPIYALAIT